MITWYLLLTVVSGQPQTKVYTTEQQACVDYLAAKAAGPAFVYQLSGKKDSPAIAIGDCKPVQQFVTSK
jgi:hypothetical protein